MRSSFCSWLVTTALWSWRLVFYAEHIVVVVVAWHTCGNNINNGNNSHGICPDGNKCCPLAATTSFSSSSKSSLQFCISGKDQGGDCCRDDGDDDNHDNTNYNHNTTPILTGCAEGFVCAYHANLHYHDCAKMDPLDDSLPDRIPRYKLCSVPPQALQRVYGLPVLKSSDDDDDNDDDAEEEEEEEYTNNDNDVNDNNNHSNNGTALPQLAYLSTMGALDATDHETLTQQAHVQTIIIVVHGSGMNVDDYLCATSAAIPPPPHGGVSDQHHSVQIVAPWFVASYEQAGPVTLYDKPNVDALRWEDIHGPIYHTWRYGANAINGNKNVSSYAAMDALVDRIRQDAPVRFPRLERIVVAGHSAGGQYTQRWALLSNSWGVANHHQSQQKQQQQQRRPIALRAIVANPKSFCFLDNRRFINGTFKVPEPADIGNCTEYNHWQWGLEPSGGKNTDFLPTPYKDRAIVQAGGVEAMKHRYAARDVVYLAGELDTLPNGNCMARLQGPYRRVRSEHFMASLHRIFGRPVHHRLVVSGVHHNHALMFQSPEGQMALFGSWLGNEKEIHETVASQS